ncbi:MAG: DNA-binding domain-containing protein, partial [Planctomycetota bacterium]
MSAALRELQRWFAAAVTAPVAPGARRRVATGGALAAAARVGIYRFAYRERLLGVLTNEHPAVRRLVGNRCFRALALAYVRACPSQHCNLNRFAARFPGFLARTRHRVPHRAFALELARLEAALSSAFDAEESAPLPPDALAAVPPGDRARLRFTLHPSVRFLACRFPTNDWFGAHRNGRRARAPRPRRTWLLVHRHHFAVQRLALAPREYAVLRALAAAEPLVRALQR